MALDQNKIVKNTTKYFKTANEKGFMTPELTEFLGEDFIKAPATTDKYNAFEGGLIAHILLTTSYAVTLNNSFAEDKRVDSNSLIKVCLLLQIGKAKMFQPETNQWWIDKGKLYDYVPNTLPMRVGERSVYYAMNYGVNLTEEEVCAILLFDRFDDTMAEYYNTRLGRLVKYANELAILEEKNL